MNPKLPILGRKQALNLQGFQILDSIITACSFWGAHKIRAISNDWALFQNTISPFAQFQWVLFIIIPFTPLLLDLQGFYTQAQKSPLKSLKQLFHTFFWLGLIIASCSYFLQLTIPNRTIIPLFGILLLSALLLRKHAACKLAPSKKIREPIILAGMPSDLQQFRLQLSENEMQEVEIVDEFNIETTPLSNLVDALHQHSVSRVIFAGGHSHLLPLQQAIAACEIEGVEVWLVADFIRTAIARPVFDVFGTQPMLVFRTAPDLSWALACKNVMDKIGAAVGILVGLPLLGIIALGIKLTSPGPIFFRQTRSGLHGRPFILYKFRSMIPDADLLQDTLASKNEMEGPVFKIEEDPRITRFGKFLRRSSFDELPQLFNVLKGEMSLVGPRPLPTKEVARFETTSQRRRLSMKPGLTCLWQISGRNKIQKFDQWVALDLQYIDGWSLALDLKILLKTIPIVCSGLGAS